MSENESASTRIRSFLALELSEEVRARLADLLERLRKGAQFTGAHPAWVRAENIHLTLHFLGAVEERDLEAMKPLLDEAAARFPAPALEFRGLGCFPNDHAPKVIWVGLRRAGPPLTDFHAALKPVIRRFGIQPDTRPFHPHLTLARVKSLRGVRGMMSVLISHRDFDVGACQPGAVTLFRSDLRPEGALYTPLHHARFASS